jgi:hypothetical protein
MCKDDPIHITKTPDLANWRHWIYIFGFYNRPALRYSKRPVWWHFVKAHIQTTYVAIGDAFQSPILPRYWPKCLKYSRGALLYDVRWRYCPWKHVLLSLWKMDNSVPFHQVIDSPWNCRFWNSSNFNWNSSKKQEIKGAFIYQKFDKIFIFYAFVRHSIHKKIS